MLLTPLQDVLSQPAVVSNDDLGHALAMIVSAASTVLLEVGDTPSCGGAGSSALMLGRQQTNAQLNS